jgi:hypothetical protein
MAVAHRLVMVLDLLSAQGAQICGEIAGRSDALALQCGLGGISSHWTRFSLLYQEAQLPLFAFSHRIKVANSIPALKDRE